MRAFHSHYSSAISVALVLVVTSVAFLTAETGPTPDADPGFRGVQYASADDPVGQGLDDKRHLMACRQERKKEIAHDLIRGKLTLLEAAGRFREIDEQNPDFNFELFRKYNPASCDEERHCRQVISYLCTASGDSSATAYLIDGYEDEVRQLFDNGAVAVANRKTK